MAPLLDIQDLRTEIRLRHATVHALDGVSLTVDPGECLGVVGESGSGKTMTALSVMRLLPGGGHITGGQILLDDIDLAATSEEEMEDIRGNLIGMIFQDPLTSLNPTMTIGDQIAESVRLHRGASKAAARERAIEVLGLVGMPRPQERVTNHPHQLSGGMRQRVMIAMALACEPKLLIADEPTTALDVTISKQILELIDDLRQRLKMAVILVTHDLGVIAAAPTASRSCTPAASWRPPRPKPSSPVPATLIRKRCSRPSPKKPKKPPSRAQNACTTSPASPQTSRTLPQAANLPPDAGTSKTNA
jgi:peptide/nickel transport system ATP-binding protein